jgi:hypothetical protein
LKLKDLMFYSPRELRELEQEIRVCEIQKGKEEKSIYLDLNVNDIFRTIYIIHKINDQYYKISVRWDDENR